MLRLSLCYCKSETDMWFKTYSFITYSIIGVKALGGKVLSIKASYNLWTLLLLASETDNAGTFDSLNVMALIVSFHSFEAGKKLYKCKKIPTFENRQFVNGAFVTCACIFLGKQETLVWCCYNAGPPSATLGHNYTNIMLASFVCWVDILSIALLWKTVANCV